VSIYELNHEQINHKHKPHICAKTVIHQVAQAGFPEEPPKDEQAVLIHAEFSDSAGPEKAPFSVFPLL
jgi:hypothetical protein